MLNTTKLHKTLAQTQVISFFKHQHSTSPNKINIFKYKCMLLSLIINSTAKD